ncbi:MAG TPA: hypothetical protein VFC86_02870, partial [Planctomycetota bacterium]|nr:hypothetical protein [Planctomycetota bacterium]
MKQANPHNDWGLEIGDWRLQNLKPGERLNRAERDNGLGACGCGGDSVPTLASGRHTVVEVR